MSINLLPEDYQIDLRAERLKRLIVVAGAAVFLIAVANTILLSPVWVLFVVQEREMSRQLESLEKSPAFLRLKNLEDEIGSLNYEINSFNDLEKKRIEIAPAISSILDSRPAGVRVSAVIFSAADPRRSQPPQLSVRGTAPHRDLLFDFASANRDNNFFSKIHSPISNLLKETNVEYSLVFDLAD